MRINKYIAASGVASRRKADELIKAGKVKINGLVTTELGYEVEEGWVVEVEGRIVSPASRKVYIMLHKPKGFITTVKDDAGRPTVMNLVQDISERIFPIGRLDNATSGLLLMTNDGEFANLLMHPKNKIYKTYQARVLGMMTRNEAAKLARGVMIDGVRTAPAIVQILKQTDHSTVVEIKIYEGRNRQVRKMCEAVGHKVLELHRSAIGNLTMGHLKEGHYKKLKPAEVEMLRREASATGKKTGGEGKSR